MEQAPSRAYQRYLQGRAWMEQGRLAEAVDTLTASAAEAPHFKTLELLGECLMQLGRHRDAVVPLAAATTLNRGMRAPTLLAEVFLALDCRSDAADLVRLALERNPTYRRALALQSRLGLVPHAPGDE